MMFGRRVVRVLVIGWALLVAPAGLSASSTGLPSASQGNFGSQALAEPRQAPSTVLVAARGPKDYYGFYIRNRTSQSISYQIGFPDAEGTYHYSTFSLPSCASQPDFMQYWAFPEARGTFGRPLMKLRVENGIGKKGEVKWRTAGPWNKARSDNLNIYSVTRRGSGFGFSLSRSERCGP